jgi:hypothetical protein
MPPLHFANDPVHYAGADLGTCLQSTRNVPKEGVAAVRQDRPGRGHDGCQFGIGKTQWHGDSFAPKRWRKSSAKRSTIAASTYLTPRAAAIT